jgi:hypothetical protein
MNDFSSREISPAQLQDRLVREFIEQARSDLAGVRAEMGALETLDSGAWRRTQVLAHNIGARAEVLKLGVLQRCARELEHFSLEILDGKSPDKAANVEMAMVAVETIDLELSSLEERSSRST